MSKYAPDILNLNGVIYVDGEDQLNASNINLTHTTSTDSVPNYRTTARGNVFEQDNIDSVEISWDANDIDANLLTRLTRAVTTQISTSLVADELVEGTANKFHIYDGIVTVTGAKLPDVTDPTEAGLDAVEGTDFEIVENGIKFLTATKLFVTYNIEAHTNFEALAGESVIVPLQIVARNYNNKAQRMVIKIHKFQMSLLDALNIIKNERTTVSVKGKCLADDSKGEGVSAYYHIGWKRATR